MRCPPLRRLAPFTRAWRAGRRRSCPWRATAAACRLPLRGAGAGRVRAVRFQKSCAAARRYRGDENWLRGAAGRGWLGFVVLVAAGGVEGA